MALYYICLIIFFMAGFILGAYLLLSLMADKKPKEAKPQKIKKKKTPKVTNQPQNDISSYSLTDEELMNKDEEEKYKTIEERRQHQTESYNYNKEQAK